MPYNRIEYDIPVAVISGAIKGDKKYRKVLGLSIAATAAVMVVILLVCAGICMINANMTEAAERRDRAFMDGPATHTGTVLDIDIYTYGLGSATNTKTVLYMDTCTVVLDGEHTQFVLDHEYSLWVRDDGELMKWEELFE